MISGEQIIWEAHIRELPHLANASVIANWVRGMDRVAVLIGTSLTKTMTDTTKAIEAFGRAFNEGMKPNGME